MNHDLKANKENQTKKIKMGVQSLPNFSHEIQKIKPVGIFLM